VPGDEGLEGEGGAVPGRKDVVAGARCRDEVKSIKLKGKKELSRELRDVLGFGFL
jgi:hypothetical protein